MSEPAPIAQFEIWRAPQSPGELDLKLAELENLLVLLFAQLAAPTFESLTLTARSADPPHPPEGHAVRWLSDGTESGDGGDVLVKITFGGVTRIGKLVDFSALEVLP